MESSDGLFATNFFDTTARIARRRLIHLIEIGRGASSAPKSRRTHCIKTSNLRLSQGAVDRSMKKLFGLPVALGTTNNFKEEAAEKYQVTYNTLIKELTSGLLIHADETKISTRNGHGFVWVFANMQQVVYIYNETREGTILHTLLKDFTGVLVSDFYPAYEGVQCSQQKCLIHLIRDLNDDLLKHPFDEEFKWLVRAFTELLRPMVETIDRHGLQSRFLKQHLASVDKILQSAWEAYSSKRSGI